MLDTTNFLLCSPERFFQYSPSPQNGHVLCMSSCLSLVFLQMSSIFQILLEYCHLHRVLLASVSLDFENLIL